MEDLRKQYMKLDTGPKGTEIDIGEGFIVALLSQNYTERMIRILLGVGGSKIQRLRNIISNGGLEGFHTRKARAPPHHALTDADHCRVKLFIASIKNVENGFPCPHRHQKIYLTDQDITWTILHQQYRVANIGFRLISQSRWIQLVKLFFPGVRLTRSTEDACDCCVRINIQLKATDISDADRERLKLEKNAHLDQAIAQRRVVTTFMRTFVSKEDPTQPIPQAIPDVYDEVDEDDAEPIVINDAQKLKVQVQIEDFGGSLSMPFYGKERPSADYFNSNLNVSNFVIADMSRHKNVITFYDERAQGKGADALCSLRFSYHRELARQGNLPEILVVILDNCVGQNKSQCVMRFFAMLSILFYKKVVLIYLIPGHSPMLLTVLLLYAEMLCEKKIYTRFRRSWMCVHKSRVSMRG